MAIKLSEVADQPGGEAYLTLYDDAVPQMERTRMSFEYATRQHADAAHKSMTEVLVKAKVVAPAPRPR
jgi:hypothetical protein